MEMGLKGIEICSRIIGREGVVIPILVSNRVLIIKQQSLREIYIQNRIGLISGSGGCQRFPIWGEVMQKMDQFRPIHWLAEVFITANFQAFNAVTLHCMGG
jgi:hypothetical protein